MYVSSSLTAAWRKRVGWKIQRRVTQSLRIVNCHTSVFRTDGFATLSYTELLLWVSRKLPLRLRAKTKPAVNSLRWKGSWNPLEIACCLPTLPRLSTPLFLRILATGFSVGLFHISVTKWNLAWTWPIFSLEDIKYSFTNWGH